jgi:hypothetical protein
MACHISWTPLPVCSPLCQELTEHAPDILQKGNY